MDVTTLHEKVNVFIKMKDIEGDHAVKVFMEVEILKPVAFFASWTRREQVVS